MTYNTRRILFTIFTLLFFIITPLTILYTAGYKISLKNFRVQKTGAIIIETKPKGAKIFFDNKLKKKFLQQAFPGNQSILTPAKLKNFLPGEYDLRLELDGYWPWTKKITINPNQTTILSDIILFKKDLPLFIDENFPPNLYPSPDKSKIAALNANKLFIFDVADNNLNTIEFTSTSSDDILWSSSGNKLIIGNDTLIDADNLAITDLNKLFGHKVDRVTWDINDDNVIYYLVKDEIRKLEIWQKKTSSILRDGNVMDFFINGGNLFILDENVNAASLNVYSVESGKLTRKIDLPGSPSFSFLHKKNKYINLYDQKHKILYLIDPFGLAPLRETINNVISAEWIDDDSLLYNNDHEILIYYASSYQKRIITRISESINNALWYTGGGHVIYNTDSSIFTIELGDNQNYNITELIKMNEVKAPVIDPSGDFLYFYGAIGSQKGLYKLGL